MEENINKNLLNNDPSANLLINILKENITDLDLLDSILYHQFPIYVDDENQSAKVNVLMINKHHGIILFKCTEQSKRTLSNEGAKESIVDELEHVYSLIYSKLIKSKFLRKEQMTLKIKLYPVIFLPNYDNDINRFKKKWNELSIIKSKQDIMSLFNEIKIDPIDDNVIKETLSIIEGAKGLIRPKERTIRDITKHTKGCILNEIRMEIFNFDNEQKRAGMFIIDGPQRIRGLAGSGKTIVLSMKAAKIHLEEPNAEILYTFYTKSLYSLIKRLITRFYRQFADRDPNWNKVHILHAWGGKSMPGVYYNACIENDIRPIPFSEAKSFPGSPFNKVCQKLEENDLTKTYDYALIDEGQDFPTFFYRLCRKITKDNKLVWAYDECQNIFNIRIQDTKETFGTRPDGKNHIDFDSLSPESPQDLVLHTCYRNPRKILVVAFAIGLGIYNDKIIQILENNKHWEDLGFKVLEGNSKTGSKMIVTRPEENSPLVKNKYLDTGDTITIKSFDSLESECKYIVDCIINDLADELIPEDILVISLDDRNARKYFDVITEILNKHGINTFNILNAPPTSKNFFVNNHITLTTVYRAKGNEAGHVIIAGIDGIFRDKNLIESRNKIFTAITRSNAWVTITGFGEEAKICEEEIKKTLEKYPKLEFIMPDKKSLRTLQRDLDRDQEKQNQIKRLISSIAKESGVDEETVIKRLFPKK